MNLNPRKMIDLMFRKRCVEIGLKKEGNLVSLERRRREGGSISTATTDEAVGVYVRTMHKKPHHMHSTLRITATRCPMFPDPVKFFLNLIRRTTGFCVKPRRNPSVSSHAALKREHGISDFDEYSCIFTKILQVENRLTGIGNLMKLTRVKTMTANNGQLQGV